MLCDFVASPAAATPAKPAIVDGSKTINYAQLDCAAGILGRHLHEARLGPGMTVAIQMPNSADYVATLLAVWRAGATAFPLDPALTVAEVESYVARTGATAVLRLGDPRVPPIDILLQSTLPPLPPQPFAADATALLLLSSGTAGLPKFVTRTAASIQAAADILQSALPCSADDRVLGLLPFYHSAGLFNALLATFRRGATLYVEPFSPRQTLATVERRRITVLLGAPLIYRLINETPLVAPLDLSSIRIAYSSTAALSSGIVRGFEDHFGILITQTYGSTETHEIAATRQGQRVDPPSLVGKPYPGITLSIRDEAGLPIAPGAEGTVWVHSPGAAEAYFCDPQATAATFRQGWVVTGDLGRLDAAGDLFILGRRRPLLSVAGKKIAPAEVEACLRSHPAVADAVVRGASGSEGREFIKAQVVRASAITASELRDFCAARLADFKVPRQIEFVNSLSRGPLGKSS